MSTFTQFNGCGYNGPSAKDLIAYQTAYTTLATTLEQHIKADAHSTDTDNATHTVHGIVQYVKEALNDYLKTANFGTQFNTALAGVTNSSVTGTNKLFTKTDAESTATSKVNSALASYLPKTFAETGTNAPSTTNLLVTASKLTNSLRSYLTSATAASTYASKTELTDAINGLNSKQWTNLVAATLTAQNYLTAVIHARKSIDFTEWASISAMYAGTGGNDTLTNGCYILGCVSLDGGTDKLMQSKSGRVYLKYQDTASLDAILDFAVTKHSSTGVTVNNWSGAITATISKKSTGWTNLKFHLVVGTAPSGVHKTASGTTIPETTQVVYICVSADGLASGSSSTNLQFDVCGENFIPLDEPGCIRPSTMVTAIATISIKDTTTSQFAISGDFGADAGVFETIQAGTYAGEKGEKFFSIENKKVTVDGHEYNYSYLMLGSNDFSQIVFTKRPSLYDENNNLVYFVTAKELMKEAVPVGAILKWAAVDDNQMAKNVPTGYLACNGAQLMPTDYPDLTAVLGVDATGHVVLPTESYAIIKAVYNNIEEQIRLPDYDEIIDYTTLSSRIVAEAATRRTENDNLSTRITTLGTRVTTTEGNVTSLDTRVTTAEGNVTSLGTRVTTAEGNINQHTADITALGARISDETLARQQADSSLSQAIATEQSERAAEDNRLAERINLFDGAVLDARITAEVAAREQADTLLQQNIDNETRDREDSVQQVQNNLEAVTTVLQDKDTELAQNISNLETAIGLPLDNLATDDKSSITAAINETKTATDTNKTAIETEVTRASSAETSLLSSISSAESIINTKIGDLSELTTSDKNSVVAAVNEVNAKADAETSRAESAEQGLHDQIGNVADIESRFGVSTLTEGIKVADSRRQAADTSIRGEFATADANIRTDVDKNAADITDVKTDINKNTGDISALDTRVTALENA